MIKEFLVKEISNTLDRKINIESKIRENNTEINELNEHIRLIREGMDISSTIFIPGTIVSKDENKIKEYANKKHLLSQENDSLSSIVTDLELKLAEIQKVYEYVTKAEQYTNMEKYGKNFASPSEVVSHKRMLEIQEIERKRIAMDLHDSIVQNLTSIVHKVEYTSKVIDNDLIKAKLEMKIIEKNVSQIISEMRDVIYNLRPMSFDDIGFDITVERELARLQASSNVKITYRPEGRFDGIDSVIEITLFRIIQECCSNILNHANASRIDVFINCFNNQLTLIIKDDGCGFDPNSVLTDEDEKTGFGLSMMKERVYLLSGKITINSNIGKGTEVIVEVPLC